MAAACASGDAGSTNQSARPTAEPNVPGATGAYPTPNAVAHVSANVAARVAGRRQARTTRVPANRSWRPRWSWLRRVGSRPRPAGTGEHEPRDRALERAAEVERLVGIRRDDFDPGRHLAERLAARGERDEVADVLHDEERHERSLRQQAELRDAEAADLHREIDHGDVDGGENQASRSPAPRFDAGRRRPRAGRRPRTSPPPGRAPTARAAGRRPPGRRGRARDRRPHAVRRTAGAALRASRGGPTAAHGAATAS